MAAVLLLLKKALIQKAKAVVEKKTAGRVGIGVYVG